MTQIFDNLQDKTRLGWRLQEVFEAYSSMDVAVGYFNLRGWEMLDAEVRAKMTAGAEFPVARVLIGMVMPGEHRQALEALQRAVDGSEEAEADRPRARERRNELVNHLREQLMHGMPTQKDREALQSLHEFVQLGAVELKVFTRRPLHGKTYIFHREDVSAPHIGFVGSSNLTFPGLMSNLELNTDVVEQHAAEQLARWFQERWVDRWSLSIQDELLELLEESWASPLVRSPYEVYLKVCHDLSRDVREGLDGYVLTGPIAGQLLEYQATAVKTLARRVMAHRGTMLGDVVGLGKTLTAVAVAQVLRDEHGYQPLVVCPKNLQSMWERHMEAYDLHGRVVPYSMVHRVLPDLRRYPFVIVDESHTLRNENTRTYNAVHEYISVNDSKVLLLTATPYNLRFTDVANQLGLYIDEDEDLGIAPVNALAENPHLAENLEFGQTTLAAFRKSEHPEDWKRLMGENLVRRTRSFIRDNYAETDEAGRQYLTFSNGERFTFPDRRAIPVDHEFTEDDPAAKMVADTTLDAIKELQLPRYDLAAYLAPSAAGLMNDDERSLVEDLQRSRGQVAGFVRTNFYKRLSSCGHSFILSLQRHLSRNRLFLHAIDEDLPLPAGTIDANVLQGDTDAEVEDESTTSLRLGGQLTEPAQDYALLEEKAPASVRWIRPQLFTSHLRRDLVADSEAIEGLLSDYGAWSPEGDSKLAGLLRLVQQEHPGEKVLIFTEYKDTADYVAAALQELGVEQVDVATGEVEDPTALARRFSPKSNSRLIATDESLTPQDELRVLVATDVLSEGQNLQDAHVVVNYDLPWAIIKLIQRAGRVDRVGQDAEEVLIYTISHGSVEDVLNLRTRIQHRLAENASAFGSDERFFGTEGEVRVIKDLYDGTLADTEAQEDVDASSLAFEVWRKATQDDPALAECIAGLPDMIDATRTPRLQEQEGVACYVRTDSGNEGFAYAHPDGTTRLLTGHEALRAFEAAPGQPGLERRGDHDELVEAMVRGPLKESENTAGRLRGERKIIWQRLGETLHNYDPVTDKAVSAIYEAPLTVTATHRLRQARRAGATDENLLALIRRLHQDNDLTISTKTGTDPIRIVSTMGVSA
ncbi:NgoFVII family restriction endonuclease [Kocuria sp. CNJ-770]|uniref:helicase-related protein n=1 Tax=Kocuria sp. CNJ-770 TaxID=1904964 RepID=UPI00095F0D4D|nr:helicase-related protein [Kocuria sp. CNJ-770]OLT10229.1 NgoFVII family restriction endonuclease [Kocuria sp. CNJ-770]